MGENLGEEKIISTENIKQAINFAGAFPEKNKLKKF